MVLETHDEMAGNSSGWVAPLVGCGIIIIRGLGLKSGSHDDIAHPLGDDIIGIDCSSPPAAQ